MGEFVDKVDYSGVGISAPRDEIAAQIKLSTDFVIDQQAALTLAIADLQAAISAYEPTYVGLDIDDVSELPERTAPIAPILDPQYNEDWPDNNAPDPIIRTVDPDFTFIEPVTPDQIYPTFDYTPGSYGSVIWDDIVLAIRNDLVNGGTGLNDLVYGLIINRNTEARRAAEDTIRRRGYDAVGARGFDLPGGMAAAVVLELEKEILAKDLDAVNSVTIKDFEMADANTRFAKELSLKLEEVQRAAYDSDENRNLDVAKVTQEMIIAVYDLNVKVFIAQWDGVIAKMEAAKAEIDAIVSANDGEVKTYLGRIEAYSKEIDAIASENESKSSMMKAEAAIYESEIKGYSALIDSDIAKIKIELETLRLEIDSIFEREKIELSAFTTEAELSERVAESIANIASQSIASAMGAVNTSISMGYSGSESRGYSVSLGNSLNEGRSYDME